MARALRVTGCRSLCGWHDTGRQLDEEPLFACSGCGSEWVPSEPWTPVDYEGFVPEPVAEIRRTRGRGWHVGQKYDDRFMNATRTIGRAAARRTAGPPARRRAASGRSSRSPR